MKIESVHSRLGRFKSVSVESNKVTFYSRVQRSPDRYVDVINQNGMAICIPYVIEQDGTTRVVYHPKTIKGLVEFLEGK